MAQKPVQDNSERIMEYSGKVPPCFKILSEDRMLIIVFPDQIYDDILLNDINLVPSQELPEFKNYEPSFAYRIEHQIVNGEVEFLTVTKEGKEVRSNNLSGLITQIFL